MSEIKKIIDDIGISSFENNMKIASLAILSDSRDVLYQTENWDLSEYSDLIFEAFEGLDSINFNNIEFLIEKVSNDGIIGTNSQNMGYIIGISFEGGILLCYALFGANPNDILAFLKSHIVKIQNELS